MLGTVADFYPHHHVILWYAAKGKKDNRENLVDVGYQPAAGSGSFLIRDGSVPWADFVYRWKATKQGLFRWPRTLPYSV